MPGYCFETEARMLSNKRPFCAIIFAMRAADIMKTHIVKVGRDSLVSEAIDMMDVYQVDSLPVIDDHGSLCGIFSYLDLLAGLEFVEGNASIAWNSLKTRFADRVSQWMVTNVLSVRDTDMVEQFAYRQVASDFTRLPVTDSRSQVVGTLNILDVLELLQEAESTLIR